MDDELKRLLECTVCTKVPRQGNIYQCKWGHCICSKCQPGVTQCPTCRFAMSRNNPGRNLVLENLVSKITHGCKFSDQGCDFEDTSTPLGSHEKECDYRLVNCTILACKTQVSLAKLLEHLEKVHKKDEVLAQTNPFNTFIPVAGAHLQWGPFHIRIEDQHFFVHYWRKGGSDAGGMFAPIVIPKTSGQRLIWVTMLASQKKCEEYIFTAKVSGQGTMEKEEVSFTGPCIPLDYSNENVAELGTCLIISDAQAKRLLANEQIILYVSFESVGPSPTKFELEDPVPPLRTW